MEFLFPFLLSLTTSFSLLSLLEGLTVRYHKVSAWLSTCTPIRVPHLQLVHHQGHLLLVFMEIEKRVAEIFANLAHICCVEMKPGVDTLIRPQEAHLERKRINQVKFSPHDLAPTSFLRLLNSKVAVFEAKHVLILLEQPTSLNKSG